MYNKFFGFKEKPFKLVPNPEYLFLSKSHEEALAHLTYAISQGDGFVEITGEVGTGKTTLCRVFLENLDASIEAAYIFNPKLDALQLLKAINDEFGIDSTPDTIKDLSDRLNTFLMEKKAAGQKVLVLIDEAQNLSLEVLEQLRLLSNLETTQEKLLQIILVGQPELGDMLSSYQLRQLGQRITISCRLSPLTYEETRDYIRHRIALASHRAGPPFDKSSYRAIYEYSGGIPRLINIACDRTLLNAFSRNSFKVTNSITKEAIRELTRKKARTSYSWLQAPAGLIVLAAILIPVILLLLYHANGQSPEIPASRGTFPPEPATQAEIKQAAPQSVKVSEPSVAPEIAASSLDGKPVALQEKGLVSGQAEETDSSLEPETGPEPIALAAGRNKTPVKPLYEEKSSETGSGDEVFHSVHAGTFRSAPQAEKRLAELKALGYPSFLYTQEKSPGDQVYVVVAGRYPSYALAKEAGRSLSKAGYSNFVARAKDSLAAGRTAAVRQARQPRNSGAAQDFLSYLQGLNSRFSRNSAMEEILKLWFPAAEIKTDKNELDIDRFFFAEAAKQYDLQAEPIAGASDALIQALNLPVIFSFYLKGQAWPKYLAVVYIDEKNIFFAGGGQGQTVSVDRDIFLQYWSGEAYVFWKNFNNLPGVISQRSRGQDIRSLQILLQQLGYGNIIISEKYDKNTLQTIRAIQTKYGLPVDGLVGPLTKIALYNESVEFKKPSLAKFGAARTENGS